MIIETQNPKEFMKIAEDLINRREYQAIVVTLKHQIVLSPKTSTKPLITLVLNNATQDDTDALIKVYRQQIWVTDTINWRDDEKKD